MTDLLLTIACSTSIALILKYSSVKKGNSLVLLASNYFVAALLGFIMFLLKDTAVFSYASLFFGMGLGAIFVASFFAFSESIGRAGTALSTAASRLSVIIPVIFSILLFGEEPGPFHIAGFLLTLVTIYLFYLSLKTDKSRETTPKDYLLLIGLLVGIGVGDFSMKIFNNTYLPEEKQFFIFSIFFFAFIYSSILIIINKIPLKKETILSGSVLGVPNVFSSVFLLGALEEIAGIIVYPTTNIGIIVLTAILAYLIWKENLTRLAKLSLASGIVAIALLNL